jgi:hypothetical protein
VSGKNSSVGECVLPRDDAITEAAIFGAIDYKRTFARTYASDEERVEAYSQCHLRSAKRVLRALLANGGKLTVIRHAEEK